MARKASKNKVRVTVQNLAESVEYLRKKISKLVKVVHTPTANRIGFQVPMYDGDVWCEGDETGPWAKRKKN